MSPWAPAVARSGASPSATQVFQRHKADIGATAGQVGNVAPSHDHGRRRRLGSRKKQDGRGLPDTGLLTTDVSDKRVQREMRTLRASIETEQGRRHFPSRPSGVGVTLQSASLMTALARRARAYTERGPVSLRDGIRIRKVPSCLRSRWHRVADCVAGLRTLVTQGRCPDAFSDAMVTPAGEL